MKPTIQQVVAHGGYAAAEFKMPVLYSYKTQQFYNGFPSHVLLPLECEIRAQKNHGQSLSRLAERGGLALSEIVAVIEDREWRHMNVVQLVDDFRKYHWL